MYHSIKVVNEHGYYNKYQAQIESKPVTSKLIIDRMYTEPIDTNDNDFETIHYIIEWLKDINKSGENKYINKVRNILKDDVQSLSEIGLIASILIPYMEYCKTYK